jgi:hypothetical protein
MQSATITADTGTPCNRCNGTGLVEMAHEAWLTEWEAAS